MAEILVPVDVICEILDGVSPRRVQQLAKNGVIPKAAHGQYDLVACAKALIDDAQAATSRAGDLYEQRARLVRLQGDRIETENRLRDGELCEVDVVAKEFSRQITVARTRLLAIPSKVAPLAAQKSPPEVFTVVQEHLYEAMQELADQGDAAAKSQAKKETRK